MRIFKLSALITAFAILSSCAENSEINSSENFPELYHQDIEQLYITPDEKTSENKHINYNVQHAKWIPYLLYPDIMLNRSEDEFRNSVIKILKDAENQDINTIYFQARSFGDSYYKSELFPAGTFMNSDYDALEIFISEAHKLNISVHAWINPLRCQTAEEFSSVPDNFTTKKWFSEFEGTYICNVNGRMWLNPAYEEVRDFISEGVSEIIKNYDVDGIHIDDYFYPSTDESFDKSAFSDSGEDNLKNWRIENINKLVSEIYSEIKSYDKDILFGISPQGNTDIDYNSQFADVKAWCSDDKYCDYIVPQIYFGFRNDTCPFEQTFNEWYDMTKNSDVSLVAGLAVYKQGKEDKWAGSGKNEWIEDSDIIQKQIDFISEYENVGFSLYC